MTDYSPPASDQLEINLFGPGFGESCLIHLREKRWMLVDSCLDKDKKRPAALAYLEAIGVEPDAVELIVITHWHDDHVRGLGKIVEACSTAKVCMSAALGRREFIKFASMYGLTSRVHKRTGVKEINRVFAIANDTDRPLSPVVATSRLLFSPSSSSAPQIEVWGLSPSDMQFHKALRALVQLLPQEGETKVRAPDPEPNDLSIATWVCVGDCALLLGADLEETGHSAEGWSAVLANKERPQVPKAVLFKVPHHGSSNGHHPNVWDEMLVADPVAILTPYNKNRGLPTQPDVDRIQALSSHAYSSSRLGINRFRRPRAPAVDKMIDEIAMDLSAVEPPFGHLRVRIDPSSLDSDVAMFGAACRLERVLP